MTKANVTALMIGCYGLMIAIAMCIPIPGLNWRALESDVLSEGNGLSRLSIFAIGFSPILTAFAVGQMARLLSFGRGGQFKASSFVGRTVVRLIAIGLVAFQGYGAAVAISAAGLVEPDFNFFAVVAVMTYVGTTALLIFAIEHLELPGLQSGFWALFLLPVLLDIPSGLFDAVAATRVGAYPLYSWLVSISILVGSVVPAVLIVLVWRNFWNEGFFSSQQNAPMEILIWPSALSAILVGYIFFPLILIAPDVFSQMSVTGWQVISTMFAAVTIPIFVFAYLRLAGGQDLASGPLLGVGLIISFVQIVMLLAGGIMPLLLPIPFGIGAISILAAVVVTMTLFRNSANSLKGKGLS